MYQNKYSVIFLLGNQLVMYGEDPNERDTSDYPGKLTTHSVPQDVGRIVNGCFLPWEDGVATWRPTRLLSDALE